MSKIEKWAKDSQHQTPTKPKNHDQAAVLTGAGVTTDSSPINPRHKPISDIDLEKKVSDESSINSPDVAKEVVKEVLPKFIFLVEDNKLTLAELFEDSTIPYYKPLYTNWLFGQDVSLEEKEINISKGKLKYFTGAITPDMLDNNGKLEITAADIRKQIIKENKLPHFRTAEKDVPHYDITLVQVHDIKYDLSTVLPDMGFLARNNTEIFINLQDAFNNDIGWMHIEWDCIDDTYFVEMSNHLYCHKSFSNKSLNNIFLALGLNPPKFIDFKEKKYEHAYTLCCKVTANLKPTT